MSNQFEELSSFVINDDKAVIISPGEEVDRDADITTVLPGKYRVIRHITSSDGMKTHGNLFVLHESITSEATPLNEYDWEDGGHFEASSELVGAKAGIFGLDFYKKKVADKVMSSNFGLECLAKIDDKIAEVTDGGVLFSFFYCDYSFTFDVIEESGKVVGFRVEGLGARPNQPVLRKSVKP